MTAMPGRHQTRVAAICAQPTSAKRLREIGGRCEDLESWKHRKPFFVLEVSCTFWYIYIYIFLGNWMLSRICPLFLNAEAHYFERFLAGKSWSPFPKPASFWATKRVPATDHVKIYHHNYHNLPISVIFYKHSGCVSFFMLLELFLITKLAQRDGTNGSRRKRARSNEQSSGYLAHHKAEQFAAKGLRQVVFFGSSFLTALKRFSCDKLFLFVVVVEIFDGQPMGRQFFQASEAVAELFSKSLGVTVRGSRWRWCQLMSISLAAKLDKNFGMNLELWNVNLDLCRDFFFCVFLDSWYAMCTFVYF